MAASVAARFAGKALYDFLKTASSTVSGSVAKSVASKLGALENATGLIGVAAKYPETTGKLIGSAAGPLTIAGAVAGTGALVNYLQQNRYALPVQPSAKSGRPPAFTTQPYIPGTSPLTNEQMGEALLDQQRYQHQLDLIQARQNVSTRMGGLGGGSGIQDILGIAQKIYG